MCADGEYGYAYLNGRGNARGKSAYQLDVQISKGFQLGDVRLQGVLTIINLFSSERVTSWDTSPFTTSPLGTPLAWQTPRRYELGLRVEF